MIDPQRLRALRMDRGLSQRKLAATAGVDALTIKRIEAGADTGDLTLRVLTKMAAALGVQPHTLVQTSAPPADSDLRTGVEIIGAALAAGGRSTFTGLARSAAVLPADLDRSLQQLADRLAALGIAVVRHGEEVWLAPASLAAATGERHRPLDVNQARLLRRIDRGEDVRRTLSKAERTLVLPSLLRLGLVEQGSSGLKPSIWAAESLRPS